MSMIIGSRDSEGRSPTSSPTTRATPTSRRTYFAKSALITRDEQGYRAAAARRRDPAVQRRQSGSREISFTRYDLALDRLTGETEATDSLARTSSVEIVGKALSGKASEPQRSPQLWCAARSRVCASLAICLFVAALAAFPTGDRRRISVPIELVVLGAAFARARHHVLRAKLPSPIDLVAGPLLLTLVALVVLAIRFRVFVPLRIRRQPA